MSELEGQVKPLILRLLTQEIAYISREGVDVLMRWCMKTAGMMDQWAPPHRCSIPTFSRPCAEASVRRGLGT